MSTTVSIIFGDEKKGFNYVICKRTTQRHVVEWPCILVL